MWLEAPEDHAVYHPCCFDIVIFCGVGSVRQVLRWIEVEEMLDTIVSLGVCVVLLVYLVYAMLRPEKF